MVFAAYSEQHPKFIADLISERPKFPALKQYIPFGFRYWTIQWMVTKQALEASQYMQFRRMSGGPCKAFDRCRRQVFRIIGVLSTRKITLRSGFFPRLRLLPFIFGGPPGAPFRHKWALSPELPQNIFLLVSLILLLAIRHSCVDVFFRYHCGSSFKFGGYKCEAHRRLDIGLG